MDVRKSFTDAGYITIGLGVMGFQQAQVRRRQLQQRVQTTGDCVAGRARERAGPSRTPRAATSTPRPVRPRTAPRAPSPRRSSRVQELATEVTTRVEPVRRAGAGDRRRAARAGRPGDRAGRGTRARALHQRRLTAHRPHDLPIGGSPRGAADLARSVSLPHVLAALAGGVGAARFLAGLVRAVPPADDRRDRQHRRRRGVPRPVRLARPRLGHVHARRRVEPRAGLGTRRRDLRHARGAPRATRADTWFRLGDKDLATHLYRTQRLRAGATLSRGDTARSRRAWGLEVRLLPMTDDPVRTRITARDADGTARELHDAGVVRARARRARGDRGATSPAPTDARPRRACSTRSARADTVLVCPSNPVISIGPILAVPGIRDALRRRREPGRRREPDRRRRAGEGSGRPADAAARHRGVVRRRRPGVRRVLQHARDRRGRRRPRAGSRSRPASTRSSPTR